MTAPELEFRRFNAAEARELRDLAADIYRDAYRVTAETDAFDSVEAFLQRFDAYTTRGSFDYIIAYQDSKPIGQTFGWPLDANPGWWNGLESEPEPEFTIEDGRRTFALSEIMVRSGSTGQGVAHALHDELLRSRPEARATLLVRPTNTTAYRAYSRWGWQTVAKLTPGWDGAPTFDVLILLLQG